MPSTFMTLETLNTLAGQILAVGMITQVVKASVPRLDAYWLRCVAIVSGITIHMALVWNSGMDISYYVLAVANGTLVALAAMKAAEFVKGKK